MYLNKEIDMKWVFVVLCNTVWWLLLVICNMILRSFAKMWSTIEKSRKCIANRDGCYGEIICKQQSLRFWWPFRNKPKSYQHIIDRRSCQTAIASCRSHPLTHVVFWVVVADTLKAITQTLHVWTNHFSNEHQRAAYLYAPPPPPISLKVI